MQRCSEDITVICMIFIFKVQCPVLSIPMNGGVSCTLMSGMTSSYEDTCSFTCNTGYELTGNDTRTCQSDGNWSDSDVVCIRGIIYILASYSVI